MTKYKAYPEYKDSGVEWLGRIPSNWLVIATKYIAQLTPRKSTIARSKFSEACSFVPMEKLKFNSLVLDEERIINQVYDGYTYFEDGDILIAKVTPCFENKNMAVAEGLLNGIGFGSSEIYVLRCGDKVHRKFLFYRLQEDSFIAIAIAAMSGTGGLKRVPSETINSYLLGLPGWLEQVKITDFLDHETARIDNLIEKQQQLIELLKEKRQAVISHAVTKGLNPDVPMKDSGVEWLGEVPEHWEISKVKYYCTIKGRIGFRGYTVQDLVDENEGALVLGASEMRNDGSILLSSPQYISWKKYYESPEIMLDKNMILFVQRGSTVGKVSFITYDLGKATINPSLIVLRDLSIYGEFMNYSLMSASIQNTVKMQTSSTAIPMISQEQVGNYFQLIPPLNEQLKIADFIARNVSKIDKAINTAEISISLIKERRTALISAAVTGKIDVRDWVAPDTQKTEETAA